VIYFAPTKGSTPTPMSYPLRLLRTLATGDVLLAIAPPPGQAGSSPAARRGGSVRPGGLVGD
jgi:hypothetical protein